MTFKDLKRRVNFGVTAQQQQSKITEILHNKPFWIWIIDEHKLDIKTNGNCCFNHIIGLLQRYGIDDKLMTSCNYITN